MMALKWRRDARWWCFGPFRSDRLPAAPRLSYTVAEDADECSLEERQEQRLAAREEAQRSRGIPYAGPAYSGLHMTGEKLLCCLQREAWPDEYAQALTFLFEPWWVGPSPWGRGVSGGLEGGAMLWACYLGRLHMRERLRGEVGERVGTMPAAEIADQVRRLHYQGALKTLRRAVRREARGSEDEWPADGEAPLARSGSPWRSDGGYYLNSAERDRLRAPLVQTPEELIEDLPTEDPRVAVDRLMATLVALQKGGGPQQVIRAWHDPDEDDAAALRGYEWEVADETWEPCREVMRIELEDELSYKLWLGAFYGSCRMREPDLARTFMDAVDMNPEALASPGDLLKYARRRLRDPLSDDALETALRRLRGKYLLDGIRRCLYDTWLKALAIAQVREWYAEVKATVALCEARPGFAQLAHARAVLCGAHSYTGSSFLESLTQLSRNVAGGSGQSRDTYEWIAEIAVADFIEHSLPRPGDRRGRRKGSGTSRVPVLQDAGWQRGLPAPPRPVRPRPSSPSYYEIPAEKRPGPLPLEQRYLWAQGQACSWPRRSVPDAELFYCTWPRT